MKTLMPLDLQQNEIRNAVVQNLAGAPPSPKPGQIYFSSVTNTNWQWTGTAWQPWDVTQLVGTIPNAALAVNPLARANHTGTQLSSTISDLAPVVKAYTLDQFAAPVGPVPFNAQRLTGLAAPTNPTDAANMAYVDGAVQSAAAGIVGKPAVALVSVSNIATLSGTPNIDGVATSVGQRVLLVGQTDTTKNGVWIVASGNWARPSGDADANSDLALGATFFVELGGTYASSTWRLATPTSGAITPGTTAVTFTQLLAAVNYTGSSGILITGSNITAVPAPGGGLLVSAAGLAIDTSQVARFSKQTITGDGTTTTFTLTHALATQRLSLQAQDASFNAVIVDWVATSTTQVTVTITPTLASGVVLYITLIG